MKKIISVLLFSALGGAITLGAYKLFLEKPEVVYESAVGQQPTTIHTSLSTLPGTAMESNDFTLAAEKTLNSVVHVKNTRYKNVRDPWAEFFFGQGSGTKKYSQVGTGSGVVISSDGYIVTNNHVINNATEIEITLNKKRYTAELIGADPSTDIALLKIDETDLPYIIFGNSDNIQVGEWVLAVGNPYNLTSTVTAGIVSAKGRDLAGNTNIDSFIQTDAAVNPGNSGGALVNTRGELVGINTAISSQTGAFVGYSFAVPSNIAKKVIEDLMEFGDVQEAILGIRLDLTSDVEGVLVASVEEDGGAQKAGLQEGDIIVKANDVKIKEFADLSGQLKAKRPGDNIRLVVLRGDSELNKTVALSRNTVVMIQPLNIGVKDLTAKEKKLLGVSGGAKIVSVNNRELDYYGVKQGYVITKINKEEVDNAQDANKLISKFKGDGPIYLEVLNRDGEIERYVFR